MWFLVFIFVFQCSSFIDNILKGFSTSLLQLDNSHSLNCNDRKIFYSDLVDGEHRFKVCTNFSKGVGCSSHNWTVGKNLRISIVVLSQQIISYLTSLKFTERSILYKGVEISP